MNLILITLNRKPLTFCTLFFLTVALCSKLSAQEVPGKKYLAPKEVLSTYNGVAITKNIRYGSIPNLATDSTSDRILDLFLPKKANKTELVPVFLFIHGGGFTGGDKGSMTSLCSKIAAQGFAVVSINYTLYLKYKGVKGSYCSNNMANGLPQNDSFHPVLNEAVAKASEDALEAMKWVKDNAAKYHFNTNQFAIGGGSAGAMTALYVAYVSKQKVLAVKAVVDLWGGLESTKSITNNKLPVLIYHGDKDELINVQFAYALDNRMKEIGSKNSVLNIMIDKGHVQYKYVEDTKIPEIVSFLHSNL
jgi:para-nitrobenzyl esterase